MIQFLKARKRVLLLDDDPAIRRLVSALLKRQGHRVDAVDKGNLAIEAIAKESYDAILLDLMMPHEGGMTVLAHLRDNSPALLRRVVLLTATPESVLRSLDANIFSVVRKPFEPEELVETIDRLIADETR